MVKQSATGHGIEHVGSIESDRPMPTLAVYPPRSPTCATIPRTATPTCPMSRKPSSSRAVLCTTCQRENRIVLPTAMERRLGPTVLSRTMENGCPLLPLRSRASGVSKVAIHNSAQTAGSRSTLSGVEMADCKWLTRSPSIPSAVRSDC